MMCQEILTNRIEFNENRYEGANIGKRLFPVNSITIFWADL